MNRLQTHKKEPSSDHQSTHLVDRISKTFSRYFTKKKRGNGSTNESNEDHTRSSEKAEISPTETINMNEDFIVPRELSTQGSEKSFKSDQSLEDNKTFLKNVRRRNEDLWDAAESGDHKKVLELLDIKQMYPAEVDSKALDDWTALHMAANYGHYKVADALIGKQANIEAKTTMQRTPLHLSCMRGNIEIVKLLVTHKANVNATDRELNTPLHYASEHGFPDIVIFLLEKKPKISAKNQANLTCIDIATSVEIRKIFEEKGFTNENTINSFGRAYMDDAVLYNGRADLIGKLLCMNKMSIHKNSINMIKEQPEHKENKEQTKQVEQPEIKQSSPLKVEEKSETKGQNEVKEELEVQIPVQNTDQTQIKSESQPLPKAETQIQVQTEIKPKEPPVVKPLAFHEKKQDIKFSNIKIETVVKNQSPQPTLSQREVIGPKSFIRHDTLGKGSFGEVFLVEKISDKKLYAMKVLRKDRIMNNNLTRYAKTERNVLSVMDHPFIVKLQYAFQTETKLYLILEYCPGGDLGNLLMNKKKLSEHVARIYAAEVTLALEALHKKDIIFRDLKPDNVVLDKDGHALLTDFGLSKEGMKEGWAKSFCGSIAYLAPEILTKSGHNKTVDWYLLGVLLYEMLVGIPPYYAKDRNQLYENIKKGELKLPKSLSEEARSILILLLKRDPNKRLGCLNDSEDIKNHPWFRSIDWEDALARKLNPPPLDIEPPQLNQLINSKVEDGKNPEKIRNLIEGWSFVKPSKD